MAQKSPKLPGDLISRELCACSSWWSGGRTICPALFVGVLTLSSHGKVVAAFWRVHMYYIKAGIDMEMNFPHPFFQDHILLPAWTQAAFWFLLVNPRITFLVAQGPKSYCRKSGKWSFLCFPSVPIRRCLNQKFYTFGATFTEAWPSPTDSITHGTPSSGPFGVCGLDPHWLMCWLPVQAS